MSARRSIHHSPSQSRGRRAGSTIVYAIISLLALIGMADALYLTILHLTGQSAVCGGSAACSQVLASKYAHVGLVPVAGLGLVGYFAVFSLALLAAFGRNEPRRFLPLVVGVMFLATLWFLYVQAFLLHQYCRYCLFSAAITFLLTGLIVAMPIPGRRTRH